MVTQQDLITLKNDLSIQIDNVLPLQQCHALIERYKKFSDSENITTRSETIIKECAELVFVNRVNELISNYYQSEYKVYWSTFDEVDSEANNYKPHTYWHLDGGVRKTLKLFVYLNPVTEHGGNTLIIDQGRTHQLRVAGELPIEEEKRKKDLTPVLQKMGLSTYCLAYDLKAGDALIFDPIKLAHKCLPPRAGAQRYTLSFTLAPC